MFFHITYVNLKLKITIFSAQNKNKLSSLKYIKLFYFLTLHNFFEK